VKGGFYILKGREPVPATAQEWAMWYEAAHEDGSISLAHDTIGEASVSTVFLGLDQRLGRDDGGPPILFETLIFGGDNDGDGRRYSTWDEAMAGHQEYVAREREALQ